MLKKSIRTFSFLLAALMVVTMISFGSSTAEAATTNIKKSFSNSSSYVTATLSKDIMNSEKYKTATVKLTAYNASGSSFMNSADVVVSLTDTKGKTIWSGKKSTSCTLKLGNDHSAYRIYVRPYYEPLNGNILHDTIVGGNNFTNEGKCCTWGISNPKNCSIK